MFDSKFKIKPPLENSAHFIDCRDRVLQHKTLRPTLMQFQYLHQAKGKEKSPKQTRAGTESVVEPLPQEEPQKQQQSLLWRKNREQEEMKLNFEGSQWVRERTDAIIKVCDDVDEIHHAMNMLQLLVEEQTPIFESIEGRITTVATRTEQGTKELVAANRAQMIRRKRLPRRVAAALLILSGSALAGTGIGAVAGSAIVGAGATLALSSGSAAVYMIKK